MSERDFLNHFSECVAAVSEASKIRGTGFFATRDLIVTCAHVVDGCGYNVQVQRDGFSAIGHVEMSGNPRSLLDSTADRPPGPDIAIVRLERQISGTLIPPCVALTNEVPRLADPLYSFGHPRGEFQVNGEGILLDYEGPAYDLLHREVLTLRQGNIREGMSGAPVLNRKTGRVCGVIYASRDLNHDLGGRAIPVGDVFAMMPGLKAANEDYHRSNPLWETLWHDHEGAVLLYEFPSGPVVPLTTIGFPLIRSVAAIYPTPMRAQTLLLEANRLRLQANHDAGVIEAANIPPPSAAPIEYWFAAFNEACLQGPRMLAALLLVMDDWQFSAPLQKERKTILDNLRRPQ